MYLDKENAQQSNQKLLFLFAIRNVMLEMFVMFIMPYSINPVTGRVEEEQPNPMDGMTEEQKEYEAMKLVNMFDKLSR